MKLISSFDSYPIHKGNRWNQGDKFKETIFLTAYSLLCASKFYDVTFYCDSLMARILRDLPIEIVVIPDKFNYEEDFWMDSKFYAFSKQTKPFVHIDTDVILYRDVFKDVKDYDVLFERQEKEQFEKHYKEQVDFFTENVVDTKTIWSPDLKHSFNCGSIGFSNMDIVELLIDNYHRLKDNFNKIRYKFANLANKHYEPCIVLEQYNMASIIEVKGLKHECLIKGRTLEEQRSVATSIGYTHLYGDVKYKKDIVEKVQNKFKELFPFYYNNIEISLNLNL